MTGARRRGTAIALLAWLSVGAALVRLAWLPGIDPLRPWVTLQRQSPSKTLPLLLALAVLAVVGWVAMTVALTLLARVPGATGRAAHRVVRRVSPTFLRRTVEAALGATTVLTSVTATAQAAVPPTAGVHQVAQAVAVAASPLAFSLDRPTLSERALSEPALPFLDRPATPPPGLLSLDRPTSDPGRGLSLVSPSGPRTLAHQAHAVRVTVGDSLWKIAARSLPRGAGNDQIERAWHRWYAANRAVIGDDPGLLLPGQLLTPPQP